MIKANEHYSLTDLCYKLALSPAWVKKVEKYLDFKCSASGQRGKRSRYSKAELTFLRKVKVLRLLGFGLEDIKTLFDAEAAIQNYLYRHFNTEHTDGNPERYSEVKSGDAQNYPFDVYLTNDIFGKPLHKHYILYTYHGYKKKERVEAERLEKMYSDFKDIITKAYVAARKNHELFGEEIRMLSRLSGSVGG